MDYILVLIGLVTDELVDVAELKIRYDGLLSTVKGSVKKSV